MKKTISMLYAIALSLILIICFTGCNDNSNNSDNNGSNGEHTHSFSVWSTTTMPSCSSQGMQTRICNSCGFSEYSPISATGHTEVVDFAIEATCTTDGKTEGKHCSVCNAVIIAQTTIQSTGHKYNDGEVTTKASCIQEGVKKYTCTITNCLHSYTEAYSLPTYTATELYNQSVKYVGEISIYDKSGIQTALATGFVISSDGKIVANYHVIDGAYSADITINNKTYSIDKVLAYDESIDLAVLKINATGLDYANVCKNAVQTGETVYAIGSSKGLTNTFSQGIITQAQRVIDDAIHIQHDAAISSGNSGGPLLNVYGEVIGINKMSRIDSQNINMAVFTTELDNLVYGTPMTLAEFYELNNVAFDTLVAFILENGEYDSSSKKTELRLKDGYNSSNTQYHIVEFTYNPKYNCVDLTHFVGFSDSDITFFTGISLEKGVNSYYWAIFVSDNGTTTNKMSGYIEYETFTRNTLLGYNTYEGKTSQENATRESASLSAVYLVEYLEWLATNYLNSTVAHFGFVAFSDNSNNDDNDDSSDTNTQYQEELAALTSKYNADVAELQAKIDDCQTKIESCQNAINNAQSQLASLSSTCPQWFLQQYIDNWRDYGSTGAATVAAQNAWAVEYNNQKNQLNNTISINQTAISGHQTNISLYTSQIEVLITQYNADVNALKAKYGVT